jgi:shikimate dehydrogenase
MAAQGETRFGLLGRRLGHSWSPQIHSRLGSSPYALIEKEPDEVEAFIREGAWEGLNVTIPYKRDAARLADVRSERVERTGAANTLVRRPDGTILADNTDVLGFLWLLSDFCGRHLGRTSAAALGGRKVLVLGSGGASAAVTAALEDEVGAEVRVISRTGDETYATILERHADAVLVVNTTPVGMYPDCPASPLSDEVLGGLPDLLGVVDVVYNPRRTGLCLAAERLGIPSESGLAMLVAQARCSSELFQGTELDEGLVRRITNSLAVRMSNIAFIGMPGVGKTSTGKRLARMLCRPFVDLDDVFTIDNGMTPAEFISERGEDAFRAAETRALARYGKESELVIACGGGVVTRQENRDLLRQNATIVMLERPIDEISDRGRPISQTKGLERLAAERMPLYHDWADVVISCQGSPVADAQLVKETLGL